MQTMVNKNRLQFDPSAFQAAIERFHEEQEVERGIRDRRHSKFADLMNLPHSQRVRFDPVPDRSLGIPVPPAKRHRKLDRFSRKLKAMLPKDAPRPESEACKGCWGEGFQMGPVNYGPDYWRVCEECNGSGLKEKKLPVERTIEWRPILVHEPLPDFDFGFDA